MSFAPPVEAGRAGAPRGQASTPRGRRGADQRVEEFLAFQRASGPYHSCWSRAGLLCLLDVLRELGVVAAWQPAPAGTVNDVVLARFERYLLGERP